MDKLLACPVLVGQQVRLRPFVHADITDRYISWLNDRRVVRFSNQRFVAHDRASCLRYLSSFTETDNCFLVVLRADTDEAIGTLTAYISRHHGTADVGILIGDTAMWGRGYGQDAWDTLVNWLLRQPQIRKVTAGTLACNRGMLRIMERSGMTLEAVRRAQEIVEGRLEDIMYFAKFSDS